MLGYIKAYKPELKMKDYEIYKGVYCSLCKKLSRSYSPLAQIFLSYDFTFLLLLKMSLSAGCPSFKISRCNYNPFVKCKTCTGENKDLDFCADTAVIMSYYKIKDNISDSGSLKRVAMVFLFPFIALMHKKAKRRLPDVDQTIKLTMKEQKLVESNKNCGIDIAADPTAKALSVILTLGETDDEKYAVLKRLGYLIGRWVYIIDAVDDLDDDIKSDNFNPLKDLFREYCLEGNSKKFNEYSRQILSTTAGEAVLAFELLAINRFRQILENILYEGLAQAAEKVLKTDRRCDREKSL